jgi:hypothetical protein
METRHQEIDMYGFTYNKELEVLGRKIAKKQGEYVIKHKESTESLQEAIEKAKEDIEKKFGDDYKNALKYLEDQETAFGNLQKEYDEKREALKNYILTGAL